MKQPGRIEGPEGHDPKAGVVQREELALQPERAGMCEAGRSDTLPRDLLRRRTLDDLARAEYAEGMYAEVPDDLDSGQ